MGGIVAGGLEVDTPSNKRQCHNKRHGMEEEVMDATVTKEEHAVSIKTVAAGWDNEEDETG